MAFEPGWDSFSTADSLNNLYSSFTTEDSLSIQDLPVAFSPFDGDASSLTIPATPEYITPAYTTPPITTPSTAVSDPVLITTSPTSTVSFTSRFEDSNSRHETVLTHTSRSPHLKTPKSNSPPTLHSPASALCETWLEGYPHIFPKPKHIRALTDLTSEPALTIERLLNQRMRPPLPPRPPRRLRPPPAHSTTPPPPTATPPPQPPRH
ncbi:uncharacterized protein K441DRAFT_119266 [Cenococcum geophilum 1.58]|uniref:uncharacterized protein n=1 Tax=Cenococcum geophilum 1.58 TaxID=794803 RepID=UPI00358FE63D|nr:hypothetical protein K441DRAFT_119266 [Cenococcum geophilum 1.58]